MSFAEKNGMLNLQSCVKESLRLDTEREDAGRNRSEKTQGIREKKEKYVKKPLLL